MDKRVKNIITTLIIGFAIGFILAGYIKNMSDDIEYFKIDPKTGLEIDQ